MTMVIFVGSSACHYSKNLPSVKTDKRLICGKASCGVNVPQRREHARGYRKSHLNPCGVPSSELRTRSHKTAIEGARCHAFP